MLEFGWLNVDCNDNEIRILLIITNYDLHICMLHEHSPDHPLSIAYWRHCPFLSSARAICSLAALVGAFLASSYPRTNPFSASFLLVYHIL